MTEIDAAGFDLSWYKDSTYFDMPGSGFKKLFITRDSDWLKAAGAGDTAPDDYVLVAFVDNEGVEYLVTYADGMAFEYDAPDGGVNGRWSHLTGVAHCLTVKSDWLAIVNELQFNS